MAEFLPIYLLPGRYGWQWGIQEEDRNTHFPIGVVTNWDEFSQYLEGVQYDYHQTEGLWQIRKTIYQSLCPEMEGLYPRRDEETNRLWGEIWEAFDKHLEDVIAETSALLGPPTSRGTWKDGFEEFAEWELKAGTVRVELHDHGEEFPIQINIYARRPGFDPYRE